MRLLYPLLIALCGLLNPAQGVIDFEETSRDFVLETRKIEIPGYPHAFNPSIIRWKGELLLTFRYLPPIKPYFTGTSAL